MIRLDLPPGLRSRCSAVLASLFLVASTAYAQCAAQWLPGDGIPGVDGVVYTMLVWDADGPGPLPPVLVIGGDFRIAGNAPAQNVAIHYPGTGVWLPLGSGTNAPVYSLGTLPNGDLVVGGDFTRVGNLQASRIARWNGSQWSAFGTGMSAPVNCRVWSLATLPNGDLVAGGVFTSAGDVAAANIARWDGASWSPMGTGMNNSVRSLHVRPNGELVVGGYFTTAGNVAAAKIARWNGTAWSALGNGVSVSSGYFVGAMTTAANGDLLAGGQFLFAGTVPAFEIARWNGTAWSALPANTGISEVRALVALPNGDVIVGGHMNTLNHIQRLSSGAWSGMGPGLSGPVDALVALPSGEVIAGGGFGLAGGATARSLASWNGSSWSAMAPGNGNSVYSLAALPNGDIVAGGIFLHMGAVDAARVARWDGSNWAPLGTGITGQGSVDQVVALANGDVVAAGSFRAAGGAPADYLARWDGTNWSPLGTALTGPVQAMAALPNGDLVVSGPFTFASTSGNYIARWNGSNWSPLAAGSATSLLALPNGQLVAGAYLTIGSLPTNCIARWDGTAWSSLGTVDNTVRALALRPNGDVVAGGYFTQVGGVPAIQVASWNGTVWRPMGSGVGLSVSSLAVVPGGDLVVGCLQGGGANPGTIMRWNGTTWNTIGAGMGGWETSVHALATMPNGDLVAGGSFSTAGGLGSAYIARLSTTCPASATAQGAGCIGAGGLNVLTASSLPWTNATFRSVATGMPNQGLALEVMGWGTASVPLPAILPQGVAGCSQLVTPDATLLLVPSAGSVSTTLVIPASVTLAGLVVYQQIAAAEINLGSITAVTSTNRLALTIGSF